MPLCLLFCVYDGQPVFLKSCTFLESRFKSYGKWVGNTRHACQGPGHQATLAHCQANCWTAAWHNCKSPLLAARVPGSWLGRASCPASFWAGRQAGRKAQLGIVEQCGAAVTTAGANSLAHNPPFPSSSSPRTAHKGCRYLKYVIHSFQDSLLFSYQVVFFFLQFKI